MLLYKHIQQSWKLLNLKIKKTVFAASALMTVSSLFDVIGIGLIFPIVKVLIDDTFYNTNQYIIKIRDIIGIDHRGHFVIALLIALILLLVIKSIYSIAVHYNVNKKLSLAEVHFSQSLFKAYLSAPMSFLHARNSSELLRNIYSSVPQLFTNTANLIIQFIAEMALIFGLLTVLLIASPSASILAAFLILCAIILFILFVSKKINNAATLSHDLVGASNKVVLEALEGVEEIRILGCEDFFLNSFKNLRQKVAAASVSLKTISQIPRYYLEVLISLILVVVVYQFIDEDNGTEATAVLALYGVAAMRMMPAATRLMGMLNQIKASIPAVTQLAEDVGRFGFWITQAEAPDRAVLKDYTKPKRATKFKPNQKFKIINVSYHYDTGPKILDDVSIDFKIGQAIGLVGPSGSGKSTFIGIILGLLPPQTGALKIDEETIDLESTQWRQHLGYVPQHIYLRDDTICKNIALGLPSEDIEYEKISKAISRAQLDDLINTLPDGINTIVGERGIRLSGGQRQRIGIARALYNDPDILIFDEATSALDVETETQITDVLHKLRGDKTLIIVAHRLSTIQECDKIIFMEDGEILESGTFSELETNCNKFHQLIKLARLSSSSSIN